MSGPGRSVYLRRHGLRSSDLEIDPPSGPPIAVDVMGADADPAELVAGVALAAERDPARRFLLCGDAAVIAPAVAQAEALAGRVEIRHAPSAIAMADKPSDAIRRAEGSSMAAALDAVGAGEATAAVSSGNTGALMAMASLRLGRVEGVARPAIAVLWPTVSDGKQTVVLDVGADVKMDAKTLEQCAQMGALYAAVAFETARPRVGLLNVGAEAHKGAAVLHEASERIAAAARQAGFAYHGFIEANDIPMDVVDVAVTDGFTGNVALKAAEGTARLIQRKMKESLTQTPLARVGALLASGALRDLKRRLDPRAVNGGVFLGLRGAVVKSHGAVDATGFAAAIALAHRVGAGGLAARVTRALEVDRAA